MANLNKIVTSICLCLQLSLGGCVTESTSLRDVTRDKSDITSNRLRKIFFLLLDESGESDRFPNSLSAIKLPDRDKTIFLSPDTGSKPGDSRNVKDWTDFIYVGNCSDQVPRAALVVSPPENHRGKYGYVLCVSGECFRLSPHLTQLVIKQPWLLATNTPLDNVNYMRASISVHIPNQLRHLYTEVK